MQTSKYDWGGHPLLEPENVLPAQFFDTASSMQKSGEHRLLWAVLADAIHCFQSCAQATAPHKRRLFTDAEWWIMQPEIPPRVSDAATDRRLVFEEVCVALGLDAECVRAALRRWRDGRTSPTSHGCWRGNRNAEDDPI